MCEEAKHNYQYCAPICLFSCFHSISPFFYQIFSLFLVCAFFYSPLCVYSSPLRFPCVCILLHSLVCVFFYSPLCENSSPLRFPCVCVFFFSPLCVYSSPLRLLCMCLLLHSVSLVCEFFFTPFPLVCIYVN